ncbi:MAG: type VI secretion system tip protein VgrG [Polyangiaceae bacterium]|nr:type VI secretion system tip protein VgrG [Polyangiaceae bacterium]
MPDTGDYAQFTLQVDGVTSPIWVAQFDGTEALSELYHFDVWLTSEDKDIVAAGAVGKTALLSFSPNQGDPRYVHGIVSRFRHLEDGKKLSTYHLTILPSLFRLKYRFDTRIFQNMTVPDIIEQVLGGAGISPYRLALSGSHPTREYCVQYRESDLAFISRLMEEEGIYYFFEHTDSAHTLVLADSKDVPAPIPSPDSIVFRQTLGAMAHSESVSRFAYSEEVRPGKVSLTDYNFKKPSLSLMQTTSGSLDTDLEVYDYPGEYELPDDGGTYAQVRLEAWQVRRITIDGESGCLRMIAGYTFSLSEHPREAENRAYLLTRVRHRGAQPQMMEGAASTTQGYSNFFQCIPSDVPFRPEPVTPRPTIKGIQTAIVTGPGGEEVHTDEHGRVKVQFHWDRQGKKDENSSCWIRVSQLWAGAGWGAMWIPRIGHEVVVDFIEGDPDRPLIVGRVYHGANVPPYALPAEKTKSTIKSNSSIGGGGSNEFRFEDKAGQEEIYLHGQKDWTIKIENDKNQWVGHDETKEVVHNESYVIGNDQALEVGHNRDKVVKNDQTEDIGHDKTIHVANNHAESIDNNEAVKVGQNADRMVGANQTVNVSGDSTFTVGGAHSDSIGKDQTVDVGGGLSVSVAKASSEAVGGAKSLNVGKDYEVQVAAGMSTSVSKDQTESVTGEKKVTVGKKFILQVGDGKVTVEKNGNITIEGKDITIKGSGKINVQATSKVTMKCDGPVNVEASGAVKVKGSKVDIN